MTTSVPSLAGSGGWRDDSGLRSGSELRFARDERGFPGPFGSNPIGVFTGIDQVSRGSDNRWSGSLGGTIPSGRRVRTHGQLTWNAIDGDYVSQFGASQSGSRRVTARGQTDISAGHGLDLSAGLEFLI